MQWGTRQSQNIFVYHYISIISVQWCQRRIGIGISHSVLAHVRYHHNYPLLWMIKQIINYIHTPTDTRLFLFCYWILYRNPIIVFVNGAVVYHKPAKYTHISHTTAHIGIYVQNTIGLGKTFQNTPQLYNEKPFAMKRLCIAINYFLSLYVRGKNQDIIIRSHSVLYDNLQLGT